MSTYTIDYTMTDVDLTASRGVITADLHFTVEVEVDWGGDAYQVAGQWLPGDPPQASILESELDREASNFWDESGEPIDPTAADIYQAMQVLLDVEEDDDFQAAAIEQAQAMRYDHPEA